MASNIQELEKLCFVPFSDEGCRVKKVQEKGEKEKKIKERRKRKGMREII